MHAKALDEISSLNLTINLLVNEMKLANLDILKNFESDIRNENDDKVNAETLMCTRNEWRNVENRCNTTQRGNPKANLLLNTDTIITSNRYEILASLTDEHERVDNEIEFGKQVKESKRINKTMKQIPTIINGAVYPRELNRVVKCRSETTNKGQASNSSKPRVLILGNSHLKGCIQKIDNYLATTHQTSGWIKSGAPSKEILNTAELEVEYMKSCDVIVLCAGANDVYRNNSIMAYRNFIKYVKKNNNTNIVLIEVPHRHDLSDRSCVNIALQLYNSKLRNIATRFKHVTVIEGPIERQYFTLHGLHYNRKGKA